LSDKAWKAFERRVAERSGGTRISVSDRKTDLDVDHNYLGIECKYRNKLPQYLKDWYAQAERGSSDTQIPVVVIGEKNSSKMYALMDFDKLTELIASMCALLDEIDQDDKDWNYGGTD